MNNYATINDQWRADIPLLRSNNSFVYLDNSATALKPQVVIDEMVRYYSEYPSNVHRGTYQISVQANEAYAQARESIRNFFNIGEGSSAYNDYEVIFTSGMTQGSNLIANSHRKLLDARHKILVTILEHHSSMLPWWELCAERDASFVMLPVFDSGELDLDALRREVVGASVLAITGMSNVTGYCPPLEEIYSLCSAASCRMVVDAAQLAAHKKIDLTKTPFDALVCSAHKLGGPMGIGAMCIKKSWLKSFESSITGGGTVESVNVDADGGLVQYLGDYQRYEAGTPNVSGAIGFAKIVEYFENKGWDYIEGYEKIIKDTMDEQFERLRHSAHIKILGNPNLIHVPILSFVLEDIHPQDVGFLLEQKNICVRHGKLCAEPLIRRFACEQVMRVSAGAYNTKEEIVCVVDALVEAEKLFGKK